MPSPSSTADNPSPPPPPLPTSTITTIPSPLPPPQPPTTTRKFPAPCWAQEETLALIHAYQDKWYSLRRRNLRTADWEAVADEVNRRCPDQSPLKTSAQCRHKMEKLRKRYRAEKQRIASLPPYHHHHNNNNNRFFPSSSWVFFDLMDNMEIGPVNNVAKEKEILIPVKEEKNFKGKDDLGNYFDEILMSMGKNNNNNNPVNFRLKNQNQNQIQNERYYDEGYDYGGNTDNGNGNGGFDYNDNKIGRNYGGGFSSSVSNNNNKRKLGGGDVFMKRGVGVKEKVRERGKDVVVEEMAATIKMLGEGLIRMETMKMEMMQEIERNRMEMEMKRNEMMLQSQHTIVNAFLQGMKKHKAMQID